MIRQSYSVINIKLRVAEEKFLYFVEHFGGVQYILIYISVCVCVHRVKYDRSGGSLHLLGFVSIITQNTTKILEIWAPRGVPWKQIEAQFYVFQTG
jgi:hypothetical protein